MILPLEIIVIIHYTIRLTFNNHLLREGYALLKCVIWESIIYNYLIFILEICGSSTCTCFCEKRTVSVSSPLQPSCPSHLPLPLFPLPPSSPSPLPFFLGETQEKSILLYLRGFATACWAHNGIHSSFNLPTIIIKEETMCS